MTLDLCVNKFYSSFEKKLVKKAKSHVVIRLLRLFFLLFLLLLS